MESLQSLDEAILKSSDNSLKAVLIFKHSTRCSISAMAKNRFEREWIDNPKILVYYLDLLRYRDVSDAVADRFSVNHESPQILVIKNGVCIYHASHNMISVKGVMDKFVLS